MKALNQLLSNGSHSQEPLRLFSKLTQIKHATPQPHEIHGIPMVDSDDSDAEDHQHHQIESLSRKIEQYKLEKARQIAALHFQSGEDIDIIVADMRDDIHREVRFMIDPSIRESAKRCAKSLKEGGSTLPGSEERIVETPGFDLATENSTSKELVVDLREFTLGQKN